jgi:hypothetical protein
VELIKGLLNIKAAGNYLDIEWKKADFPRKGRVIMALPFSFIHYILGYKALGEELRTLLFPLKSQGFKKL